ncbi:MAG: ABC transporter ATP-binding protein [Candidatus Dormibacterales bacterium]
MSALLEIEGVCKSFGGLRALDECSLEVPEGGIAGLIGPNGSGKTTLFNVITGYVRSDAGQVRLRGQPIGSLGPDRVFALGVGRTFQLTRIFARLSVLENMLVATQRQESWLRSVVRRQGSTAERQRALELLDFVGLTRLASAAAGTLSYGQRKLLELAYILVADPTVILLDEPAGGINPTLINDIRDSIVRLNQEGKTFLVVEHNMEFVMGLCHQVTVMDQGRAIVTGSPAAVRKDPRVLDAYLGGAGGDHAGEPKSVARAQTDADV